jgi:hypothetical protein
MAHVWNSQSIAGNDGIVFWNNHHHQDEQNKIYLGYAHPMLFMLTPPLLQG